MEIKCLQCGKPVPQTAGKRKKEFCNSTCRTTFWKKKKDAGKEKRGPGRPKKNAQSKAKVAPEPEPQKKPAVMAKPDNELQMPAGLSKTDMLRWHKAKNFNK